MSALVGSHPLKRRYYGDMRNALVAASLLHVLVFAIAPPYRPRPFQMKPDFLRIVDAVVPSLEGGPAGPPARADAEPTPPRERLVANLSIRTQNGAAEIPPAQAAARSGDGGSGAADGTGRGGGTGTAYDEAPPVFYSYDTAPRVRRRVEPEYPAAARDMGAEGTVVVNLNIDEKGRIMRAWVATASANEILINAALDAAYEFEFVPGAERDVPVKCTVAIPFQFTLKRVLELTEDK